MSWIGGRGISSRMILCGEALDLRGMVDVCRKGR